MSRSRSFALLVFLAVLAGACRRKHIAVGSVPEIPYPTCDGAPLPAGEVVATQHMRPGPTSLDPNVDERYELRHRGCVYVATVRQAWPLGTAAAEVVFDENLLPLRAWRRTTIPGSRRADGDADIRRYELRTPEVTIKRRGPEGVTYEILRGPRPRAVIGPGRGLLTAWIRRAHLRVGERLREPVLDFREIVERLQEVTLRREADLFVPWLGHAARVYTIYGREPVFADETDAVIGDLAGMRPDSTLSTTRPAAMPLYSAPDPQHTP
ncbi:MAG: hypothetical protein WCJ30_13380 [Deltaproteobacteria bacterium]